MNNKLTNEPTKEWLLANKYALDPEFGKNRSHCPQHYGNGRVYVYDKGGYYTCWECVKEQYRQSLNAVAADS